MKDLEKRRRIMQRSIRLGHCICDARKPCPCDLFREKDVCTCAGERLEAPSGPVRLTQLVEKAGCASKIDQATLKAALRDLPPIDDPRVLVGMAAGDDAGVYQLDDGSALVQTVDVFSPSVDDPYTFGQVAAANSLSDVYAMGGRPISALSIIGFSVDDVPAAVMTDILRGGIDKMNEAGVPVIGGHSIRDKEIKAGFAVTGLIDPAAMMTNAGAKPGDALVLTKPLGTGILSFAVQIDRAPAGAAEAIAASMTALNRDASELMCRFKAHAATDVTGFGLMGHLSEMAARSGVDVEIVWDDLPLFDGVLQCLADEIIPGGVERNRESSAAAAVMGPGTRSEMLDICLDPQTSGGLLIALPAGRADDLLSALHAAGITAAAAIGRVTAKGAGRVHVTTNGTKTIPEPSKKPARNEETIAMSADRKCCCSDAQTDEPCCQESGAETDACCCSSDAPAADGACCSSDAPAAGNDACCGGSDSARATTGAQNAQQLFGQFMKAASAPGALDAVTKQMIAISLSVLSKCGPCVKHHVAKARKMGISEEEIDEAAWMAVAFGGAPIMMFYKTAKDA